MQKVIIETSQNLNPEEALEDRLKPLFKEGYRVVSATTSLVTHGTWSDPREIEAAKHVYYATTVVLEK